MKYVVKNKYGIALSAERKSGEYAYIPKSTGEASYAACNKWTCQHDTANTCIITPLAED